MLKKYAKRRISIYFIITLAFCQVLTIISGFTGTVHASAQDFYFSEYEVDYYLFRDDDGTSRMRVEETFVAVFPDYDQNRGISRIIPYTNNNGKNLTMASDSKLEIDIYHNGIKEEPYEIRNGDGNFTVYIGDPDRYVYGEQTYTLIYEFQNMILDQNSYASEFHINDYLQSHGIMQAPSQNWQELYWDTNGNDWLQQFGSVIARVHFYDDLIENYQNVAWCYVGKYGESGQNRCTIRDIEDGIEFAAVNLRAEENLTFNIQFDADTFKMPEQKTSYLYIYIFGVSIIFAGLMINSMRKAFGKISENYNYYQHYPVHAEYTPYKNLTVADMAENHIGTPPTRGVEAATLIELAISKKIQIIEDSKKKNSWSIKILSKDLTSPQRHILKILSNNENFAEGSVIEIKKHSYSSALVSLQKKFSTETEQRCKKAGLISTDPKIGEGIQAGGTILSLLGIIFLPAILAGVGNTYTNYVGTNFMLFVSYMILMATFIAMTVIGGRCVKISSRTKEGLTVSRYLDGMREYIKLAEADRLKMFQSVEGADTSHEGIVKLYEKLLPYAMILGLEKSWLSELSKYYDYKDVSDPTWYVGAGAFHAARFTRAMNDVTRSMNTSIAHATHSSSSGSSSGFSGGGGGGFSGGGGGGGGGGGW